MVNIIIAHSMNMIVAVSGVGSLRWWQIFSYVDILVLVLGVGFLPRVLCRGMMRLVMICIVVMGIGV